MGRRLRVSEKIWSKSILSFKETDYDLYFNGCSFVQGSELQDRFEGVFCNLIANHFKVDWFRNSKVGGSNDRIWRVTMEDIISGHRPKLVIIGWSGPNRLEYLTAARVWRQAGFLSFRYDRRSLKIADDVEVFDHPDMTVPQYNGLKNYIKFVRSVEYNLVDTLNRMISLRHFLNSKGIPHLFYWMSKGQVNPVIKQLDKERLEGANIMWSPQWRMKEKHYYKEIPELYDDGWYEWTKGKVPYGKGDHPLEEGHQLIADRIIEDIYDKNLDKFFN